MDSKREIVSRLKQDILRLQGFIASESHVASNMGLGPVEDAFPNGTFPRGGVHEFISESREEGATTCGFIGGLLSHLMKTGGVCLWIGTSSTFFPLAAKVFGVEPDRIIFVDMPREREVLWAVEEALKCRGLAAVVAELQEMDFVQSRRLQLAVEKSRVTGLVIRNNPRSIGSTACVARWQIKPLPSVLEEGLPGVGHPRWEVELLKVRNGNAGRWQLGWSESGFVPVPKPAQMDGRSAERIKMG